MRYAYVIGMNVIAAGLIGAGCHGCSGGHVVWGWAVFAGLGLLTEIRAKDDPKDAEPKAEVTP